MDLTEQNLIDLNVSIQKSSHAVDYHMAHVLLVEAYSIVLNSRLGFNYDEHKLRIAALSHDLLKDRSFNPRESITINEVIIPLDLTRYVRSNLDELDRFGLGDYYNTDIHLHALSSGLCLIQAFNVEDPDILYPVFFHSCPIVSVYINLEKRTRDLVDILMLADKLSSNQIRINYLNSKVRVDMDKLVFGPDGNELDYTTGLFAARVMAQRGSKEPHSVESTNMYYQRLKNVNPLVGPSYQATRLGENKVWPERISPVVPVQSIISQAQSLSMIQQPMLTQTE